MIPQKQSHPLITANYKVFRYKQDFYPFNKLVFTAKHSLSAELLPKSQFRIMQSNILKKSKLGKLFELFLH